ncbi:MAG TPA: CNNM domain-containing protein [Candidatus Hypogeohydataceae bacterium YC40]
MEYYLLILALCLDFLYAGSETGFYCLNRMRLHYREIKGWWAAKKIANYMAEPQKLICAILIGNNIAHYLATIVFTSILMSKVSPGKAEMMATLILAPFLMIFCEIVPKSLFQRHADNLFYKVVPLMEVSSKLFYPLVILLGLASRLPEYFIKAESRQSPFFSPQRLSFLLEEGTEVGALSMYQNIMARNIMAMGQIPVKKVMIPLEEVTMAPDTVGPETLKDIARARKYSRIPVYRQERSNVVGILTLLDFLREDRREVSPFVKPAIYLDAELPVDDALLRLRHSKQRMGIVTDGTDGKAIGIITIKDLVEEIVGELSAW